MTEIAKENGKIEQKVSIISEWLAICAAFNFCIFRYLESTTFYFTFSEAYRIAAFSSVVLFGLFRFIYGIGKDYLHSNDKKEKKEILLKGLLGIIFAIPSILIADRFGYSSFAYIPFVAYCFYGTDTDKILKCYAICLGILLSVTIACALSGSIENIMYLGKGAKGRLRGSYGICYPTDFASGFIYLFLFFWAIQRKNSIGHTALFIGMALIMTYGIYTYPRSITSTICGLVIALVILYDALNEHVFSRYKRTKWITKTGDALTIGAFPLFGAGMCGLAWLYGQGNGFAFRMDQWMSGRISSIWNSYLKYGIQAFGALTPQNGSGGGLIHSETYEFLDSTYGLMLIRYGWVLTLIVTFLWVWMTYKAIKTGHRRLALTMAVIAFHSISEHHFPELNYNILLAMPLCSFAIIRKGDQRRGMEQKTRAGWIVGAIILIPFVILLPRMLSFTRSLFALQGWTGSGEPTLNALIYWLLWIVGLIVFWLLLRNLIVKQSEQRKEYIPTLVGLAAIAVLGMAGILWTNNQISMGMKKYKNQIASEATTVEAILDAAEDPVYAGQMEEIYKRTFPGFSDRILSSEEICRSGRGSIFLEHDNEGYQLINSGALYTEISPYTGLFTYDDAVVEALSAKGYRFHSLIFGYPMEQFAGTYAVTFILHLTDKEVLAQRSENDIDVCILRASAEWGNNIRSEKVIKASDFDEDGMLSVNLSYSVRDTYGIEYLVFCQDDIELLVKRIAWRSNPTTDIWRKYTTEGLIQCERYFTTEGELLEQPAGYYGIAYEYAQGSTDRIKTQYLDADGKTLKKISSGYAQILDQWDALHHVTEERYLDEKGNPCLCTGNYAGYQRSYDSRGNTVAISFFDAAGHPIRTVNGYAAAEWAYDAANNQIYERYLDETGTPILLSSGYAERHREYDSECRIIKESYYDTKGNMLLQSNGYAVAEYAYDEANNRNFERYLDTEYNPILNTSGYAEIRRVFNLNNQVIRDIYYNEAGEPIALAKNQGGVEYGYDAVGRTILIRYLDKEGRPVQLTDNYCEIRRTYSESGKLLEESYYDPAGKPSNIYKRYARYINEYDKNDQLSLTYYKDAEGNLVECGSSYFHEYLLSLKNNKSNEIIHMIIHIFT